MAYLSRGGLWLTSTGSSNAARTDGILQAVAKGEMRLSSTAADVFVSAQGASNAVRIGAGGLTDVLSVGSNLVVVNADLQVRGTIDRTFANDLYVKDVVICVGVGDSGTGLTAPSAVVDGAGLVVGDAEVAGSAAGVPHETSVRWRRAATASNALPSACWDLRAGQDACVRLTRPRPSAAPGVELSYGLRTNARDELELFRATAGPVAGVDATYRRLVCFSGARGTTTGTGITLPVSRL
jgi:hypothetical protein